MRDVSLLLAHGVLFGIHAVVVLTCMFGWMWRRTRGLALGLLAATGISWYAIGPLMGFESGFCVLWHWHRGILKALGMVRPPRSFTAMLIRTTVGIAVDQDVLAHILTGLFALSAAFGLLLLLVDRRQAGSTDYI